MSSSATHLASASQSAGINTVRAGTPSDKIDNHSRFRAYSDDTTSAADAASAYPLTIHNCGGQVTPDRRPERIFTSGTTPVNLLVGAGAAIPGTAGGRR
jgi:hypothetical protein